MKTNKLKKALTFGDFVSGIYRVYGKRKASGIVRLALESHLVEFRKPQRLSPW